MLNSRDFGVAISTTGDPHRMKFLETSARNWRAALGPDAPLVITVDGDEAAAQRVADAVWKYGTVLRVGQPGPDWTSPFGVREGRLGVAVNKNTGIEALMRVVGVGLFLSDDDTSPLSPEALELHTRTPDRHTMVCWGLSRLVPNVLDDDMAYWRWPRGAMLYIPRRAIVEVGGFREAFGPGGHEHVEFSRRAGMRTNMFASPEEYADRRGQGAGTYWHAEDRPQRGEGLAALGERRAAHTSVRRRGGDWDRIGRVMATARGGFVSYKAEDNGRLRPTAFLPGDSTDVGGDN